MRKLLWDGFFLTHLKNATKLGIRVKKANLLDFSLNNKFDIITTLHTLFAFSQREQIKIISEMLNGLSPNGCYIFDLPNVFLKQDNSLSLENLMKFEKFNNKTFEISIKKHDFYDGALIQKFKKDFLEFCIFCLTEYILYLNYFGF